MKDKILEYIKKKYALTFFYPSFREIKSDLGIGSTSCIHRAMKKLENEGIIIRRNKNYRLNDEILDHIHMMKHIGG